MYMQRTTSGAAGNGLYTTIKCMRGAAGIGLGTTIKHLRRTTSGAAGNSLGATMKCLRCTTSAAANGLSTTPSPLVVQRLLKKTQSPTPGHVPRSACVWGPSLLAVFISRATIAQKKLWGVHLLKKSRFSCPYFKKSG
jgi:hypothetical protein